MFFTSSLIQGWTCDIGRQSGPSQVASVLKEFEVGDIETYVKNTLELRDPEISGQ